MKLSKSILLAAAVLMVEIASAQDSVRLTDVIKSSGTGTVDFFKDVTAAQLEQLRLDNGGRIVIGVDVNESANGTEKASTQAVTLGALTLTITYSDNSQKVYDLASGCCTTETQALVAEAPDTLRLPRYTLVGESGSSRITANNAIQGAVDSTIKIEVDSILYDPASGTEATSVVADIAWLNTNTDLGDPEAFYDFTNGFEDLALLNAVDSEFIDDYGAGQDEAVAVILTNPPEVVDPLAVATWNYFPSASSYYLVGYEDLYPKKGDYDFNDLTVAYRIQHGLNADGDVVAIQGLAYLITRGSAYSHDWRLKIALPADAAGVLSCDTYPDYRNPTARQACSSQEASRLSGDLDITVFSDTRAVFPDPAGSLFVNSQLLYSAPWYLKFFNGPKSAFRLDLDAPVPLASIQPAPFDPYLYVRDTARLVRLMEVDPAYQDSNGYPFGMLLTSDWKPPLEFTDTGIAYPLFQDFVLSEGSSSPDWYSTFLAEFIVDIPGPDGWAW